MRRLIFSGLIACVHGLGDTFPYLNTQVHLYSDQTSGDWVSDTCFSGNKQSPIDIISQNAVTESQPDFVLTGYDQSATVDWMINGQAATSATSLNFRPKITDHAPYISGGPLPEGEGYRLKITSLLTILKLQTSGMSSAMLSSIGQTPPLVLDLNTLLTERNPRWRCTSCTTTTSTAATTTML